jgi:hypothetical protein
MKKKIPNQRFNKPQINTHLVEIQNFKLEKNPKLENPKQ